MSIRPRNHISDLDWERLLARFPAAAVAASIMFLLKLHYSTASAEQLRWMLGPTAFLTGLLTTVKPVWEAGIGYTDFAHGIIIAPACAGVNFMIMAFGSAALCGLYHLESPKRQAVWVVSSLVVSYMLALAVNTARIALSIGLYGANIEQGWLTAARIHRMAGTAFYFGALWIYISLIWRTAGLFGARANLRNRDHPFRFPSWMILGWYLAGAIGVPLVNGAWRNGAASFAEHALTVGVTALVLFLAVVFVKDDLIPAFHERKIGRP